MEEDNQQSVLPVVTTGEVPNIRTPEVPVNVEDNRPALTSSAGEMEPREAAPLPTFTPNVVPEHGPVGQTMACPEVSDVAGGGVSHEPAIQEPISTTGTEKTQAAPVHHPQSDMPLTSLQESDSNADRSKQAPSSLGRELTADHLSSTIPKIPVPESEPLEASQSISPEIVAQVGSKPVEGRVAETHPPLAEQAEPIIVEKSEEGKNDLPSSQNIADVERETLGQNQPEESKDSNVDVDNVKEGDAVPSSLEYCKCDPDSEDQVTPLPTPNPSPKKIPEAENRAQTEGPIESVPRAEVLNEPVVSQEPQPGSIHAGNTSGSPAVKPDTEISTEQNVSTEGENRSDASDPTTEKAPTNPIITEVKTGDVSKAAAILEGEKSGEPSGSAEPSEYSLNSNVSACMDTSKPEGSQSESMEVDSGPIEKQVPIFLCDENSKEQPPQNFKPFSHYNTEGKLIDGEEGMHFKMNFPVATEDNSFPDSDAASNSVPASSEPASRVNTPSKFQGQFMDFLKCSDDATEHSMPTGAEDVSQTPSEKGGRRPRRPRKKAGADENSQSATGDGEKKTPRKRKGKEAEAETKAEETKTETPVDSNTLRPEKLFEYQWPQDDKNAEWFFLQEQVSDYLQVKSFKRKYPELVRRPVVMDERNFLAESGIVSEMQCDLGLMALKSDQVYNLMSKDFPQRYQAYAEVLHAREKERASEKNKAQAELAKMDKTHINDMVKKAVKSAADFNAQFMREKREERRAYFDLQTYEIHYPLRTIKKLPPEDTKVSSYPVALIPGQYQDYFKSYSSQQLRYFPLNTAIYDPPRHLKTIYADPSDKYESELDSQSASSQGDIHDASSSSGSSSGSSSDSDSDNSEAEDVESTPAPPPAPTTSTKKPGRTPKNKKSVSTKADANATCNNCLGSAESNKIGEPEELVKCSECGRHGHPSCLELTEEMIPNIKTYPWQCMECKTCVECMDPYDEDKMMFCDHCDRGYHTFCVGLRSIPTGRWECPSCRPEPPNKRRRR